MYMTLHTLHTSDCICLHATNHTLYKQLLTCRYAYFLKNLDLENQPIQKLFKKFYFCVCLFGEFWGVLVFLRASGLRPLSKCFPERLINKLGRHFSLLKFSVVKSFEYVFQPCLLVSAGRWRNYCQEEEGKP